jgi:AcrR family transcriptional regulator
VETIAARAGVAKTTIYRRWGGLDGLLAALLAQHAAQEIPVPDQVISALTSGCSPARW